MDNNLSFGSGSQLLGQNAASAIQAAQQRRAQGQGSALQQVSPSAPTFDPSQQQPTPPQGGTPPAPQPQMNAMGQTPQSDESALIIKALTERLKNDTEVHKNMGKGF